MRSESTNISRSSQDRQAERDALYEARKGVYNVANGHWPELLSKSGVPDEYLRFKNGSARTKAGPCPLCRDGEDRYTFDDRFGDGDYVCRHCGSGKGVTFLMKFHSWSWIEAVDWVLAEMGNSPRPKLKSNASAEVLRPHRHGLSESEEAARRAKLREAWDSAHKVEAGDPVDHYLRRRVPGLEVVPFVIRFHPGLEYWWDPGDGGKFVNLGTFPAMLAAVMDPGGRVCNIHRTYLSDDGAKAKIISPDGEIMDVKKLMRGLPVKGGAIRLAEGPGRVLGVAEGIETSLAAAVFAKVPTWSVVSTSGMASFQVPECVEVLTIFADHDAPDSKGKKPGFEAAHALAKREDVVARVKARTLRVSVRTPARPGMDIADLLMRVHEQSGGVATA